MTDAEKIEALRKALRAIANDPHCGYPDGSDSYGQGVTDGHRCAASVARAALAATAPQENEGDPVRVTITEDE